MKQLDLSSYNEPVSFTEAKQYFKLPFQWNIFTVSMTVVFVAAFLFILIVPLFMNQASALGLVMLATGFVAVSVIVYSLYKQAVNRVKISRMAANNGLVATFDVAYPDYNGLYFQHGEERKLLELVEAPEDGTSIGTYQYVTGSGKSRQTHTVCFALATLSRNLPHMVLDNKINNFWAFTNLPTVFSKDQTLGLEGDFNKTFTLYAPKEYERDALYIFTPDVMQAFVQSGYNIDAEIIDNQLYVYYDGQSTLADSKFMDSIFTIIQNLGHEVEQQSNYYADERVADRTVNIVAPAGKRLKSGLGALSTVVILAYFLIQSFRFDSGTLSFTPVAWIYLSMVIGSIAIIIWKRKS